MGRGLLGKHQRSASRKRLIEITYESACESISQQRSDLRAVRGQASVVAAVNGLTATLMSRLVIEAADQKSIELFYTQPMFFGMQLSIALALIAFATSLVFSFRILLPNVGWKFDDSPRAMIEGLENKGPTFDDAELLKKLALAKEKRFDHNEDLLSGVQRKLFYAVCAAFSQIPFWLISVVASGR